MRYALIDRVTTRVRATGSVDDALIGAVPVPTGQRLVTGDTSIIDGPLWDWRYNKAGVFVHDPLPVPAVTEAEALAALRLTSMQLLYGMTKAGMITRAQMVTIRSASRGLTSEQIDAALDAFARTGTL